MKSQLHLKLLFTFTICYLFIFTGLALLQKNYEFLYYTVIFSILLFIVVVYHQKLHLAYSTLIGAAGVGVLHFAGGTLYHQQIRFYDLWLIPNFFKYDNLIHFSATFIITFIAYNLLYPHLYKDIRQNRILIGLILVAMGGGISAFNEILELFAVIYFDAGPQVGDYFNNAFDLLYNYLGAICACFFILPYYFKQHHKKI